MRPPSRRAPRAVATTLLVICACASPHIALRAARPSLYSDDIARIEMLQTLPPAALLGRPFNEHLAPGFDLVTLGAWRAAGGRLSHSRWTFTFAALLPSVLSAIVLTALAAREIGSKRAGLIALALFGISSIDLETYWWYSASSFTWALLATLLAWWGVARRGRSGALLAFAASATAPAFSGIGLLAGPVSALRGLGGRRWRLAGVCILGTCLYVVAAAGARHDRVLAASVKRNLNLTSGLESVVRAPWVRLIPGIFRLDVPMLEAGLPTWLAGLLSVAVAGGLLLAARRSPRRGVFLAALALIAGGYGLAYTVRADLSGGAEAMRRIQRYHLFPHAGLVMLLALGLDHQLTRWEDRSRPLNWPVAATAIALLLMHAGRMRDLSRFYGFPGQREQLVALDHLADRCRHDGITREQALAALPPLHVPWAPVEGLDPLRMLAPCASERGLPEQQARRLLRSYLLQPELRVLCGGMDASSYVRSDPAWDGTDQADAPLVLAAAPGGARFGESSLPAQASEVALPPELRGHSVELWWADEGEKWSVTRSVWLRVDAGPGPVLSVAELPHWTAPRQRRLRWVLREPEMARAGSARLR